MDFLDDVAEAVTRRGQDIMDLIRSGKADEVTREMLDMGDPVMNARLNEYLWNNYDLPMDTASRMERARGFQGGLYSGTGEDFPAFNGSSWATDNPDLAYTYAPSEGGNIMPLMMRAAHGSPEVNAGGANWNRLNTSMRVGGDESLPIPTDIVPAGTGFYGMTRDQWPMSTRDFEMAAKQAGNSGVTFNDIVDVGGYFSKHMPAGPQREAQLASVQRAFEPSKVEVRLYPNQVRSAFARFDPRLRHLDNLNAGVAGATAAGAGLLGYGDEANAMSAPQATAGVPAEGDYSLGYRDTLGQLYQMDGGVMYPKGQSVDGLLATVDQPAPETPQAPLSAFDEALRYYLGPTGIPERIVALNELFNPVRGLERGMVASSQALDPNSGLTGWERVGKGMDATTETLGALLGFGGAKTAIEGAAPLIDDALKAGARFGAEEAGNVPIPRLFGIGDNVGPSYSFTGEGKGVPYSLVFPDLASELRAKGTGGGLEMTGPTYKVFEGSHKRAKQLVDDRVVEMVDTFREMEDRFGRRTAMQYAADILKEVNITPSLLAAAKKANAPQWMLAAMAPTGLLAMGADDQTKGAQ